MYQNEQSKKEIKKAIPFTVASKYYEIVKYLALFQLIFNYVYKIMFLHLHKWTRHC